MRRDFEGGVYWDELAKICGEISRAVGFQGAARFRGSTVPRITNILADKGGINIISGIRFLAHFSTMHSTME